MTTRTEPAIAPLPEPTWGLGEAAWGFALAQLSGLLFGAAIISISGPQTTAGDPTTLPFWALILGAPPLWIGFIGAPVWAARHRGNGVRRDFGFALRPSDVLLSAAIGVVAQLVLVPLVSLPFLELTDATSEDLAEPAQALIDKANSPGGIALLVLVVVIGAPIAEELFYRGLLLGAIAKRWSVATGVVGSALIFGASHLQPLLFPGLVTAGLVFALVRVRTGRLGPAIVTHMAFNATTVVALLGS